MNQFMSELKEMKTIEFWHKFLENTKTEKKTTIETTFETTDDNKMSFATPLKPSFSSSSFFDIQSHPTIQDQVVLCRQIARQLVCDETNDKSKGREMFEKRVKKSSKWVTTDDTDDQTSEQSFHETTISEGPPNLRLLLDPRHVQDLNSLDFESNETEIMRNEERSHSASREIVEDLNSKEKNRGNALFHSCVEKSVDWIVENVEDSKAAASDVTLVMHTNAKTSVGPKYRFRDFNARAVPFSRAFVIQ